MAKVKAIVFDSNETLLDMRGLDTYFGTAFGTADARERWFATLQALFLTATIVGEYRPLDRLVDAALAMTGAAYGRGAAPADHAAIHDAMLRLAAHPDAQPALEQLRTAGHFTLAVLTNAGEKATTAQMKHTGLGEYFDDVISVDEVERHKPAGESYEYAARRLGVTPKELRVVACHAWDVTGALAAGCKAAFVQRPGKALDPDGKKPDIEGEDMMAVVARILGKDA